jgi:hypothetical protein
VFHLSSMKLCGVMTCFLVAGVAMLDINQQIRRTLSTILKVQPFSIGFHTRDLEEAGEAALSFIFDILQKLIRSQVNTKSLEASEAFEVSQIYPLI